MIVRLGAVRAAIPLGSVVETLRPLPLQPLPDAPSGVEGFSLVRGAPVPVLGLARWVESDLTGAASRWVILRVPSGAVALAVHGVDGVVSLPSGSLSPLPPLMSDDRYEALARLDGQLVLVLRTARIVPDSLWESLHRAAAERS